MTPPHIKTTKIPQVTGAKSTDTCPFGFAQGKLYAYVNSTILVYTRLATLASRKICATGTQQPAAPPSILEAKRIFEKSWTRKGLDGSGFSPRAYRI